jgi:hypothetical protein
VKKERRRQDFGKEREKGKAKGEPLMDAGRQVWTQQIAVKWARGYNYRWFAVAGCRLSK